MWDNEGQQGSLKDYAVAIGMSHTCMSYISTSMFICMSNIYTCMYEFVLCHIYIYIYIYIMCAIDKLLSKLCKNNNNTDISLYLL